MNPVENPYRPGAGTTPLVLAGRSAEIEKAKFLLQSVAAGTPQRSLMLYGLRGVGKTVLLNSVEEIAEGMNYKAEHLEMSEGDDFRRVIAKTVRKVLLGISTFENLKNKARRALGILKAFSIAIPDGPELKIDVEAITGTADSGDLDSDVVDLLVALGEAAREANRPICFLIDEVQYLSEKALSACLVLAIGSARKAIPSFSCVLVYPKWPH
jgi:Cdc6-like AAA superfamily ATPase